MPMKASITLQWWVMSTFTIRPLTTMSFGQCVSEKNCFNISLKIVNFLYVSMEIITE